MIFVTIRTQAYPIRTEYLVLYSLGLMLMDFGSTDISRSKQCQRMTALYFLFRYCRSLLCWRASSCNDASPWTKCPQVAVTMATFRQTRLSIHDEWWIQIGIVYFLDENVSKRIRMVPIRSCAAFDASIDKQIRNYKYVIVTTFWNLFILLM